MQDLVLLMVRGGEGPGGTSQASSSDGREAVMRGVSCLVPEEKHLFTTDSVCQACLKTIKTQEG